MLPKNSSQSLADLETNDFSARAAALQGAPRLSNQMSNEFTCNDTCPINLMEVYRLADFNGMRPKTLTIFPWRYENI